MARTPEAKGEVTAMGSKKKPAGTYQRGRVWWIKYYRDGIPHRESVKGAVLGDRTIATGLKESEAVRLLNLRRGSVERGVPMSPKIGRLTFDGALADVVADYQTNGKRSLPDVEQRIRDHLAPYFGGRRMSTVTTTDLRAYITHRQAEDAANATINRELAIMKRGFVLAMQAGLLHARPHIPMLKENNVRTGFFEPEQFTLVRTALPAPIRPVVTFAYITGWRVPSEVLPLQWRNVDFDTGTIRLDAGTTKNDAARVFPMTAELRAVLVAQRATVDAIQRERRMVIPWVFVWADGRRIRDFRGAWTKACQAAGVPGRLLHDFRRTAVRNLERAGVPRSVAMAMVGHKTESVYRRYAIVAASDLQEAALRLDGLTGQMTQP
jgi:integrase